MLQATEVTEAVLRGHDSHYSRHWESHAVLEMATDAHKASAPTLVVFTNLWLHNHIFNTINLTLN